jgi:hypothetical protein
MGRTAPLKRSFDIDDGIESVCCRICGDHRRVVSGRHLSKHDTDRDTYMEEYNLTPDELTAKVQGVWIFGDWGKALLAAGFDPRKMQIRRLWDQEKVIEDIRSIQDRK